MQTGTTNGQYFIEAELWEAEIKEELFPNLLESFPHVKWMTEDFPTGDLLTIPTSGRMAIRNYVENDELTLEDPSLNEIQLSIDKYYQAGIGVTDKFKQDSYIAAMAVSGWRQDMIRGLKEKIEADLFNTIHTDAVNGHTAADNNAIDSLYHRWAAGGTSEIFSWDDLRHAKYVFDKHDVPKNNRIFVVDPKVSHDLIQVTASNASEIVRQDVYGPNAILKEGFGEDNFLGKYYGFWVFESNMLPTMDSETLNNYATVSKALTAPVVNQAYGYEALFAAFRQQIELEQFRDGMRKRDVMSACVRYGNRVYRPESVIAVLSV